MSELDMSGTWKFFCGIIVGVVLYLAWNALQPEHWSESIPQQCAEQGLNTEITVGDDRIQSWECVAP
ncbi:MAG: hypothetical protein F4Y74_05535 [Gemmatimonadales bacterium]|nr:hypothetical protein [Gemmatimonadales bacterium]MYG18959.1 hypothetical protein [Gemmatimonadales bacterium]MYH09009.1 hypothetical protein [Gemmatimonadales bacterium]MYL05994.1 hypothetical protein [Gemmatimonadales bacterium]